MPESCDSSNNVESNTRATRTELGTKLLNPRNIDDIGTAQRNAGGWNILRSGPYYLTRFLIKRFLDLLDQDPAFVAAVVMCIIQFQLQSERRYTLLGPIVCRFLTNWLKYARVVSKHQLANQSTRNRRAHLMNCRSQGDLWDDVPFEHVISGNIIKVKAGEYKSFAI